MLKYSAVALSRNSFLYELTPTSNEGKSENDIVSSFVSIPIIVVVVGLWFSVPVDGISVMLTLKAPTTNAADDIYKYLFIIFQRK